MSERLHEFADGGATARRFVPGLEQTKTTLRKLARSFAA